jgi:hypothetical protein
MIRANRFTFRRRLDRVEPGNDYESRGPASAAFLAMPIHSQVMLLYSLLILKQFRFKPGGVIMAGKRDKKMKVIRLI